MYLGESNIQLLHELRVFLDILEPQFWFFAHQALDQIGCIAGFVVVDGDADEFAGGRVHRGFFEVFCVHLAQTLKPLHVDLAFSAEALGHHRVFFGVIGHIDASRPLGQPVERWAGQIEVPLVDQRPHLRKEEGHQQ